MITVCEECAKKVAAIDILSYAGPGSCLACGAPSENLAVVKILIVETK